MREKHGSRLEIYDRLRASEQADHLFHVLHHLYCHDHRQLQVDNDDRPPEMPRASTIRNIFPPANLYSDLKQEMCRLTWIMNTHGKRSRSQYHIELSTWTMNTRGNKIKV